MNIEIDQSGKVEETQHDTILAFSNGKSKAVSISARTKRKLQDVFCPLELVICLVPPVSGWPD